MEEEVKKDNGFWEEKNSKAPLIIIIAVLLALAVGGYIFITKYMNIESLPNNGTKSDDATMSDDMSTSSDDDISGDNQIFIYKRGYADEGPIAFTYECMSDSCDIIEDGKYILVYDNNQLKYKEMTQYEYDQIYDEDTNAVGSKLDRKEFKIINAVYDEKTVKYKNGVTKSEAEQVFGDIYEFEKQFYYVRNNMIRTVEDYNNNLGEEADEFQYINIQGDFILFQCYLFGYKDNVIVDSSELLMRSQYNKEGNFYVFFVTSNEDSGSYYNIYDQNYNLYTAYVREGHIIKDDKLYYIDFIEKNNEYVKEIRVYNSKSTKFEYNNTNQPLFIIGERYIYIDKDNNLKANDIVKNTLAEDFGVKVTLEKTENYYINRYLEDGIIFKYNDYSVMKNDDFETFRKEQGITDEVYNEVKGCISDENNCEVYSYTVGYTIKFDETGKYISKNYIFEVY